MAYRIHHYVISGSIDCREKGKITGALRIVNCDHEVQLDLQGLPNPDLAGLLLHFKNPIADSSLPQPLHSPQQGRSGDITASRKNRILDVPIKEAWERGKNGDPIPEHLANILYLEWFSEANGRVVLEVADAELEIEGPPTWQMTQDEILGQQQDMLHSIEDFTDLLSDSLEEDPPDATDEDDVYPF